MKLIAAFVIIILVTLFSFTLSLFIWGRGMEKELHAFFYISFFISSLLLFTKKRLPLFLFFTITFGYLVLMTFNTSNLAIFTNNKMETMSGVAGFVLLFVLNLLIVKQLALNDKYAKKILLCSAGVMLIFPVYVLSQHYNKDYEDLITLKIKYQKDDSLVLSGEKSFEARGAFTVVSNSKELKSFIINEGKLQYDSTLFHNVRISTNFRFLELQSITFKEINEKIVPGNLVWNVSEIKGSKDILLP